MAFELDHDSARKLAKALTARTGREIKLKDIYDDIGSLFGMRGDAMMHALKNRGMPNHGLPHGSECIDARTGLHTLPWFMEQMEHAMRHRSYSHVCFSVVFLGSLATVKEAHGVEAADEHELDFANLMKPSPVSEYRDIFHAYLGDGFFVTGYPRCGDEEDIGRRVKSDLGAWALDLEKTASDRGRQGEIPHEFAAGLYLTDNQDYSRQRALDAIERCKVKAVNRVSARRELSAFPLATFL